MDDDPEEVTTKPEERHRDLELIHRAIWFGIRTLLIAFVPLMLTAIGTLIAGYYQQKEIVRQQADMTNHFITLDSKLEDLTLKVSIMWYSGHFSSPPPKSGENLPQSWFPNQFNLAKTRQPWALMPQ